MRAAIENLTNRDVLPQHADATLRVGRYDGELLVGDGVRNVQVERSRAVLRHDAREP